MKHGADPKLEKLADEILKRDRAGVTSINAKQYVLLEDQLDLRYGREVYVSPGVPDPSICRGIYGRAWNPTANKRPTNARRFTLAVDPWRQLAWEEWEFPALGTYGTPGLLSNADRHPWPDYLQLPPSNRPERKENNMTAILETGPNGVGRTKSASIEEWGNLKEYPGYQISTWGNLRSMPRAGKRDATLLAQREHWGIMTVRPRVGGRSTERRVDDLVLETFVGPRPNRNVRPRHQNGDDLDNHLWNLVWGTEETGPARRRPRTTIATPSNRRTTKATKRTKKPISAPEVPASGVEKWEVYHSEGMVATIRPDGIYLPTPVSPEQWPAFLRLINSIQL